MEALHKATCGSCAWFKKDKDECRKSHPASDEDGGAMWPTVLPDDWCGEWSASLETWDKADREGWTAELAAYEASSKTASVNFIRGDVND